MLPAMPSPEADNGGGNEVSLAEFGRRSRGIRQRQLTCLPRSLATKTMALTRETLLTCIGQAGPPVTRILPSRSPALAAATASWILSTGYVA